MDSDLLATCNDLGHSEADRYFKDPECLDTVKCLIKFLHQEDDNDIRIQLGSIHLVRNDLIPILLHYPDDAELYSAVLRLLVNLTQPALLCFGNKLPTEVDQYRIYLDILAHNQAYKQDFSNVEVWKVLAQKVYDILEKDWEDRLPDDTVTVERILVLCRNVLHISLSKDDQQSDHDSIRDKLIIAMHNAGIDSMILYMASSEAEQQWCLHVAEIIALLLREQCPGELATFSNVEKVSRNDDELKYIRIQEEKKKKMNILSHSSRHSRFGGTFVAKGMPSLVDANDLVVHKSLQKCDKISFDEGKSKLRKARNRRPVMAENSRRKSSREVCRILKEFCTSFLENSYNHFMFGIRDKISRERSDDHDETYYFTIMSFILEFNRKYKFHVDQVSETIQVAMLHFIDVSVTNCLELMTTDKKDCVAWGRRMHCALKCYKEFILTIQMMQSSQNETFVESAKYREVFVVLLQKYDESKLSHEFLKDLIETTHLFMRVFEKYCKGNLVIVKKTRKIKKKIKKRNVNTEEADGTLTEEEKKACWAEIEDSVKSSTQSGDLPEPGHPLELFDPTSGVGEEEQQQRALKKIQKKLHAKEIPEAVVVLRQARYLWPEIDVFGMRDATWEDDTALLKQCCLVNMTNIPNEDPLNLEQVEVEEDEEEEMRVSTKEVEYNFTDYLRKFAVAKVIQPYVTLLTKFELNSPETNHYIVKMLHRVASEMKMLAKADPSYKELAMFGKFIIRKFFEVLPTNDKLVVEMLFWKQSVAHVYELTEGYGTFSKTYNGSKQWSEAELDELKQLYLEFKDGESDIVDNILARITDETRTRHQVVKQLVLQGLVEDASVLKRKKNTKVSVWREHEEMELRRLFDEFKNSEDPLGNIIGMMSTKRSKQKVTEKIIQLGLAMDRKELYKKRKRGKSGKNAANTEVIHAGGSESDDDINRNDDQQSESDDDDDSWSLIDLQSCIRKVTADGSMEQILWVKSNLEQAIEDRNQSTEDEELEPLPLVPLTEDQESAMQMVAFKKMLFFIGLQKPVTGQEMFWRIPPALSIEQLQNYVEILSDSPSMLLAQTRSEVDDPGASPSSVSYKEDNGAASLRIKRKRTPVLDSARSDSDEDDMVTIPKRKKRVTTNLSDDEDQEAAPDGLLDQSAEHIDDDTATIIPTSNSNDDSAESLEIRQKKATQSDIEESDSGLDKANEMPSEEKPITADLTEDVDHLPGALTDEDETITILKRKKRVTAVLSQDEEQDTMPIMLVDKSPERNGDNTDYTRGSRKSRRLLDDDSENSDSDKENVKSAIRVVDVETHNHPSNTSGRKKRIFISDDEDD